MLCGLVSRHWATAEIISTWTRKQVKWVGSSIERHRRILNDSDLIRSHRRCRLSQLFVTDLEIRFLLAWKLYIGRYIMLPRDNPSVTTVSMRLNVHHQSSFTWQLYHTKFRFLTSEGCGLNLTCLWSEHPNYPCRSSVFVVIYKAPFNCTAQWRRTVNNIS